MSSREQRGFKAFEHAGWEAIPDRYDAGFGSLTSQAVAALLDAADAKAGARVLDVASGPGYVAAQAAARGACVTGIDFAASMVAHARARHPGIDFRQGDAEALDFPDANFDAVVMNFGLLHLSRPDAALAEALRVLRPGGKAAFTVWANPSRAIGFGIVLEASEARGRLDAGLPPGPPFFRFSDVAEANRSLTAAGFATPLVMEIEQIWRLESHDALFQIMQDGTVRTGGLLRAQSRQALKAIRAAVRARVAELAGEGAPALPMPAVLLCGTRPR
ncbi:MAG: class I SAM-dependent methyltransferase [Burkholderiales bacterium]|nr:class I SAM-dependent methyltransferase [Burkholderiales bacterium]